MGEREVGFGDRPFLSIPPAHPAASQASLENRDQRSSFPRRKGLRESGVERLGGWGLRKLRAGDRAGRSNSTASPPPTPTPESGESPGLAGSPDPPEAPRAGRAGRAPWFSRVFRLVLFMKALFSKFELGQEGRL